MKEITYIVGHKNPDLDSIASALSYAKLKELQGFEGFFPLRAGHCNAQTLYALKECGINPPKHLCDLLPKVAYYMEENAPTVTDDLSIWQALFSGNLEENRAVSIVDKDKRYKGFLHYSAFSKKLLTSLDPKTPIFLSTSILLLVKTLNAQVLFSPKIPSTFATDALFSFQVIVGDKEKTELKTEIASCDSTNIILVTSNPSSLTSDILQGKVKVILLTSSTLISDRLKESIKEASTFILNLPYSTADTLMLLPYTAPVLSMADTSIQPIHKEDEIAKIKKTLLTSAIRRLPVVDSDNRVIGVLSEHDLTHEANISLILVDHNEQGQMIDGAGNYKIKEVIDHHRLSSFSTSYPITFINRPIGSTSTIIAMLYKEGKVALPPEIALLLLCGILSDTLILQSSTTTEADKTIANYLANITGREVKTLGAALIAAGSKIKGRSATDIIKQDLKEYTSDKARYTVSQIEVSSFKEILEIKNGIIEALNEAYRKSGYLFCALLVTNITSLSSILLVQGDIKLTRLLTFPKLQEDTYNLNNIVSRKKELIPLLTEIVESLDS